MKYVFVLTTALVLLVLVTWAQAPTGTSIALGLGTANCQSPTAGQTILCGGTNPSGLQVSANGKAYVPVASGVNTITTYVNTTPVTVSNTTTETSLQTISLAGGDLALDRILTVEAWGIVSTASSGNGTYRIRAYYGSTLVGDTGTVNYSNNASNMGWKAELRLICTQAPSINSTCEVQSRVAHLSTSSGTSLINDMPNTATIGLDTLDGGVIKFTITNSVASLNISATSREMFGELI